MRKDGAPDISPLTIYLDSNVLFSATHVAHSRFLNLWRMAQVTPVTSLYAVAEVRRHIVLAGQQLRFDNLIIRTGLVSDANSQFVPQHIRLVEKDRPILAAAITASVDYFITGDKTHFRHLYSTKVSGVYVINPADFIDLYEDRLPE